MEVIGRSSRKPEPQWCSQAHLYVGLHYTYTCAIPTQGPTLTLSNHKPTTPQYWTEPVKELCAYISQSERPTITNCRTRPVPNGPTKAIRSSGGIALYGTIAEQVDRVEPHPPLSGDCQEWQWTESDACSMGNDLGYFPFLCLGVFGTAAVQKGTHPTLSGKEVLSEITKPQRQCWLAQGSYFTFFLSFFV